MTDQTDTDLDDASQRFALLDLDFATPPPVVAVRRCPKCGSILAGVRLPVSPVDGWCRLCDRSRPLQPSAGRVAMDAWRAGVAADAGATLTPAVLPPLEQPAPILVSTPAPAAVPVGNFRALLASVDAPTPVIAEGTAPAAVATEDTGPDLSALPSDLAESLGTVLAEGQRMAALADTVRGGVSRANVDPIAGFQAGAGITREDANRAAALVTDASRATFGQTGGTVTPAAPVVAAPAWVPSTPLAADLPTPLRQRIVAARQRRGIAARNLTPAQQERVAAAERRERERALIDGAITIALNGNADGTYPHGLFAAWRPSGERTYSKIRDAVKAAAIPGIDAPKARSLRAIASDAVRALESEGYRVAVRTRGSSWAIYRQSAVANVGESVGETCVVASFADDSLMLDGPDFLCTAIRGVWEKARDEGAIGSLEITAWLVDVCHTLRATDSVYGRIVPPGMCDRWLALVAVLADLGLPVRRKPAAVASRLDVADEIAEGIRAEVESLMSEIAAQRATAQEGSTADKARDLGVRAAITRLDEIASLRAKLATFECLIGPMVAERATLTAMEASLADLADATSQRCALLESY